MYESKLKKIAYPFTLGSNSEGGEREEEAVSIKVHSHSPGPSRLWKLWLPWDSWKVANAGSPIVNGTFDLLLRLCFLVTIRLWPDL